MAQPNLHQLVFQAAKEILAEGKYPTIDLICQRLSIDPQRINENISAQIQSPSDDSAQDSALEVEILEVLTMMERIKEEQLENDFQPEEPPLEAEVEEQKLLDQSNNPEDVEQLVEKVDRKAQYMAAAEVVLTQELYRYYRKTKLFSQPDIKQQVENALEQTDADWENELENFSPAVILKKYGKSNR